MEVALVELVFIFDSGSACCISLLHVVTAHHKLCMGHISKQWLILHLPIPSFSFFFHLLERSRPPSLRHPLPHTRTHTHQFPFFCCWLDSLLSCNSLSFPQEAFIFNLRLTLLLDMLQKGIYYCKIKKRKIPWNYISQRELTSIWHKINSYPQSCVNLLNHTHTHKKKISQKQNKASQLSLCEVNFVARPGLA